MKRDLEVRLVPWNDPRFGALVRALDQEYLDRFGQSALKYRGCHDLKELEQVCLLLLDGDAVACGGFQRRGESMAVLKRLYVRPQFRRRGYGRQLVQLLELQALFQGCLQMGLETGRGLKEARALYASLGYREVPSWGPFAGDRDCLCMAKDLE